MMRSFLAQFVAASLLALVSVGALIPCPFLKVSERCCSRPQVPDKKCPLPKFLDNCPFFITERSIGLAEATVESRFTPPVRLATSMLGDAEYFRVSPMVREVAGTCDRCVLNQTLLL